MPCRPRPLGLLATLVTLGALAGGSTACSGGPLCGPGTYEIAGACRAATGPDAGPGLRCGPGTREQDGECVVTRDGAAAADGGGGDRGPSDVGGDTLDLPGDPAGDGGDGAGGDRTGDAGTLMDGNPCPPDFGSGCQDNVLFGCSRTSLQDPGVLRMETDCSALEGTCDEETRNGIRNAECTGGGFGACDAATDADFCQGDRYFVYCSAGRWQPLDCNARSNGSETLACRVNDRDEAFCVPPSATPCDDDTYVDHCSENGRSRVLCASDFLITAPCSDTGPGYVCDTGPDPEEPVCVPEGSASCDPATFEPACLGEGLLDYCDNGTNHELVVGCSAGTICRMSGEIARCVARDAVACDIATSVSRCADRTTLISCSGGFEEPTDCERIGLGRCFVNASDSATCGAAVDCDPASYQANCAGSLARNCDPLGFVRERDCFSSASCRVTDDLASCN